MITRAAFGHRVTVALRRGWLGGVGIPLQRQELDFSLDLNGEVHGESSDPDR